MGAPIKHRKKYISHKQRWHKETIESEAVLVSDYALKNKKEIRKVEFLLQKFKKIAKELNKDETTKASAQATHFLESLKAKGYLDASADSLDQVLDMSFRDILDRRLSNILYKNKLARTPGQARQFIVHRHVAVNGKIVDSPSFPVSLAAELTVEFKGTSTLVDEEHPERKLAAGGLVEELVEEESLEEKAHEAEANETVSDADKKEASLEDEEQDEVKG